MQRVPHLLIAISSHGYGHAAQVIPVINRLRQRHPQIRISLRTTLPRPLLAMRIDGEWKHVPEARDFGMVMASALEVRVDESAAAYRALHSNWERKVEEEAQALRALAPDLVLADVPYLPLAGAASAGIPAVALCSLNWADIYRHYCGGRPEAPRILDQMLAAYNGAAAFLRLEPGMPMPDIRNSRTTGPIAQRGTGRRAEINARLKLSEHDRLVVVATGGIPFHIDMDNWPRLPHIRWVVDRNAGTHHPDAISIDALGLTFPDLLSSSDALVGKPGYGSFAEAACNGTPMLYMRRVDWPEEPYLIRWLQQHGRCLEIRRSQLDRGDLGDALSAVWSASRPPLVEPGGIDEATDYLAPLLGY